MDEATIKSMAAELAKGLKTPEDLNQMTAIFKKFMIETALNTKLSDHLGYEKHQPKKGSNSRNGFSSKTVSTQDGQLVLDIPRDREGSFEPQIIKKHQTRITSMDDQILSLYAKGMTNREIVAFFKEMYDADVSASLISKVTDAVIEQVTEWQNRALDTHYIEMMSMNHTHKGQLFCGTEIYPAGSWVHLPLNSAAKFQAGPSGATLYVKTSHLQHAIEVWVK